MVVLPAGGDAKIMAIWFFIIAATITLFFFLIKGLKMKNATGQMDTCFKPFNFKETRRYIKHRLETAGFEGKNPFHSDAIKEIHRFSRGYPKLINAICNNALSAAHGKESIKKEVIRQIISDMEAHIPPGKAIYPEKMQILSRGGRKMKLQATYMKEANGSIKVTIKVMDSGDFPTVNVFKSTSENPSDEAWNIGKGTESTISNTLPSPDEAKQWVSAQVNAFKWKLDNWRSIWVPESEEFEV